MIGIFAIWRMLALRQFTTRALTTTGGFARPTQGLKMSTAIFFAFTYGTAHLIYLVFLCLLSPELSRQDVPGMLACVGLFAVNHFFSFREKHRDDLTRTPSIDGIFGFAFLRVLPMHFTLLIGLQLGNRATIFLVSFLVLKTVLDVLMHLAERHRSR